MNSVKPDPLQPSFRASTKTSPAVRDDVRQALAQAMVGVSVEVITGFTAVKPLPLRKSIEVTP